MTDMNEKEKSVYWHGLRLITLDIKWLCRIHFTSRHKIIFICFCF